MEDKFAEDIPHIRRRPSPSRNSSGVESPEDAKCESDIFLERRRRGTLSLVGGRHSSGRTQHWYPRLQPYKEDCIFDEGDGSRDTPSRRRNYEGRAARNETFSPAFWLFFLEYNFRREDVELPIDYVDDSLWRFSQQLVGRKSSRDGIDEIIGWLNTSISR